MSQDLERALSKLRFDEQVLGYSLMTKGGRPFVSFAFPEELFPRVKDSIGLYKADLRLMTIDTEKGLVVLSPVDNNWILTVLYVPELQLGLAIAKTKNVLRLLEGVELPPPPEEFEESGEDNLQVLESIALKAASTTTEEAEPTAAQAAPVSTKSTTSAVSHSPEDFDIQPSTIPKRGPSYTNALTLDSELYGEMKKTYRNFGFDVLMLVDGSNSIIQIADSMFQPNERVVELLKWTASKGIVEVPIATASTTEEKGASIGKYVKCPKWDGDDSKVKGDDAKILALCNGSRTTEEIAKAAAVPSSMVIKVLAKYRKLGLKMIGKTL
ncbi:MAG: hypothetical protein ACXAEB_02370 [Candidatus Thorarchaeota archaeon]|jgi:hypothetical protein